jgi:hypothetical protein
MWVALNLDLGTLIKSNLVTLAVALAVGAAIEAKWQPIRRTIKWAKE